MNLFDLSSETVCFAVKRHRASLKNPPKNKEQYFATLDKQLLLPFWSTIATTPEPTLGQPVPVTGVECVVGQPG